MMTYEERISKIQELRGRLSDVEGVMFLVPTLVKRHEENLKTDLRQCRLILAELLEHVNELETKMKDKLS